MPGTTPAASQLDWLISSTTTMVLFCSKAIRERLRSSTWVMGASPSVFAQRQRGQTFAAVPIASGPIPEVAPFDERSPSCREILGSQNIYCTKSLSDRGLHSGLLFQFLHAMLLIVEHGRREGERAAHAHVGKRAHDRALGVLGLDVADDSPHITEVRDFRDGLDGLDGYRVLFSRETLDQVGHQGDLERPRRIKDVHEFASLLWLIEHRRHPFDIERDDSMLMIGN